MRGLRIWRGGFFPLALFLFFQFTTHATSFEIIRPNPKTVIDESYINVVVKITDPSITKFVISDGKGKEFVRQVNKNRAVYCQSVSLKMGNNPVNVVTFAQNEPKESHAVSVFYRSEVFKGFDEEPSGHRKHDFHTDKDEQLCKTCHVMADKPRKRGEVPDNPEDSACHQCHKNIIQMNSGHAPALNWLCSECHTGKTGEYNEGVSLSKYAAPDPIMERCFSCHDKIKNDWMARKSEHGPVRDGRCNRCHNPHGGENLFFLRKPIWELCTTCHAEKAVGEHVISSFVRAKSHPTQGRPDPARPGRELVCSGCHDPHGSQGIYLLRTKGQTAFSICVRCHQK